MQFFYVDHFDNVIIVAGVVEIKIWLSCLHQEKLFALKLLQLS